MPCCTLAVNKWVENSAVAGNMGAVTEQSDEPSPWLKLGDAVRSGEAQTQPGHFSEEEQQIHSASVET